MTEQPDSTPKSPSGGHAAGADAQARGRSRRKPWLRDARVLVSAALVLVAVGAVASTRTVVLRPIVKARLGAMLGADVAMARATLSPRGLLTIENLRITARGVDGPAARVLTSRVVTARVSIVDLVFKGKASLSGLTLVNPVVRMSQSADDGRLNVEALAPTSSGAAPARLPRIIIDAGLVEFGEHGHGVGTGAGSYTTLFRLPVTGAASPKESDPATYAISFAGAPGAGPRPSGEPEANAGENDAKDGASTEEQAASQDATPTVLEGEISPLRRVGRLRLSHVDLSAWGEQWQASGARSRWRDLGIEGSIPSAEFVLPESGGPYAEFALLNVGLSLPYEAPDPVTSEPRRMRMSEVRGTVRFDRGGVRASFNGMIEDLRYGVQLATEGLALDAPFKMTVETAEPFLVEKHPTLLPFAPPVVRMRFATFSGPTALVEAQVVVARGARPDAGAAPTKVSGLLRFRNGDAKYDRFPYPMSQISGLVRFSDDEIRIESIAGVNPRSGAKLHAEGTIAPPTDGAKVDLRITFADVPLADGEMEEALPGERRGIVRSLFNREAYDRLTALGLVQSSAAAAAAAERAAEMRARLAASERAGEPAPDGLAEAIVEADRAAATPVFDLGGKALIDVHVMRGLGYDAAWASKVRVEAPRAGVLVPALPYPVLARDIVLDIDDYRAKATIPKVGGLTGADGILSADILLAQPDGKKVFVPRVSVSAQGIPIDRFLLHAIPAGDGSNAGASMRDLLTSLDLRGTAACVANVTAEESEAGQPGAVVYDVNIDVSGLSAFHGGDESADPLVSGLTGRLRLANASVSIERLSGRLNGAGGDPCAPAGDFDITLRTPGPGAGGETVANIDVRGLDLSAPIERVAEAFSPDGAAEMRRLRERTAIAGVVDARITLGGRGDTAGGGALGASAPIGRSGGALSAEVTNLREVSFRLGDARASLDKPTGAVVVTQDTVGCRGFSAGVVVDGVSAGKVTADGDFAFSPAAGSKESDTALRVGLRDCLLESALVREAVRAFTADNRSLLGELTTDGVAGVFDANLSLMNRGAGPALAGEFLPRSLTLNRNGRILTFPDISGRVWVGTDGVGGVDALRLLSPSLNASVDGGFATGESLTADLRIGAEAPGLTEDVMAALPRGAASALRRLEVAVSGPLSVRAGRLRIDGPALFEGVVHYDDASFRVGLPFTGASGEIGLFVESSTDGSARYEVALSADALQSGGLRVEQARARVRSGMTSGETIVDGIEARAYGGRITGTARIMAAAGAADAPASEPTPGGEGDQGRGADTPAQAATGQGIGSFEASMLASGVEFLPVLADLGTRWGASEASVSSLSRGVARLDGSLSLAGSLEESEARVGRGHLRVHGGEVVSLPLLIRLIEASNLRLPIGDKLNTAEARFYVDGGLVSFEELSVASDSVRIMGEGSMRYPSLDLDLRFTSRGADRIPLLSDLFEAFRDELATIHATGPLSSPDVRVEQLTGARRILGSIFDPPPPRGVRPAMPDR